MTVDIHEMVLQTENLSCCAARILVADCGVFSKYTPRLCDGESLLAEPARDWHQLVVTTK